MRRQLTRPNLVLVVVALLVTACSPADKTPETTGTSTTVTSTTTTSDAEVTVPTPVEATVLVGETNPPNTFDPIRHSNLNNWYVWQLVYEGLIEALPDGTIAPLLASEWVSAEDGLSYVFTLRDDVVFHNGQRLEADDVVYSFERLQESGIPYAQARFPVLESVTELDAQHVEFRLSSPDSSFIPNLADPFAVANAILNREAGTTSDPALAMTGTGAFAMTSYAPERELVLQRNEDYWREDIPRTETLIILYIPEQAAQLAALRAGQIHLMFPSPETFLALSGESNVEIQSVPTAQSFQINMGSVDLPLSDVRVRRAIALSIDREELVAIASLGEGSPTGPFPVENAWAVPLSDQPYYQRDIALAMDLLAEAGYSDGIDLSWMWPAGFDQVGDRLGEVLQQQLSESGIRLQLEPLETPAWLDRLVTANYDLTFTAPPYFADPRQYVIPREGRQGPTPPELDALFDRAQAAGVDELPGIYREIQMMEADLVYPFTGLIAKNGWVAYRADLVAGVALDYTLSRRLLFNVERIGQ